MKRTIAIVAGGDSSEHDVSMRSAENILTFLDTERYTPYVVEIRGKEWTVFYGTEKCAVDKSDFSF